MANNSEKKPHAIFHKYAIGATVFSMHENHIIKGTVQEIKTTTYDNSYGEKEKEIITTVSYKVKRDGLFAPDEPLKFDEEELYTSPDGVIEDLKKAIKEEN